MKIRSDYLKISASGALRNLPYLMATRDIQPGEELFWNYESLDGGSVFPFHNECPCPICEGLLYHLQICKPSFIWIITNRD